MFGSNVTSSWANPQPNQQQQQPTGAFGQPNSFGTSAFGSTGTGAFGQNQPQQQPQANPMFGNLGGTPSTNTGSTGFGAFGATNTSQTGATNPMFGATKPTTGFGAFGGGTFGGGGGAFGQGTNTASGSGTTGLFGQPATTASAFGGGTGLFGTNKPATGFGTTTTTGAAQGTVPAVTSGSTNPPYSVHTEKDSANNNVTLQYQAISCMPAYSNTSHEEIRLQDYAQGRKTASAFGTGAFGAAQPANTGLFGATSQQGQQPSAFGGTTTNTGFGAFGTPTATTSTAAPTSTGIFGGGGTFGQSQQQPQQPQGFGAFGATPAQQPQQQQTGGLFGGGGTFGSTKPAFSGFGGATGGNAFGGGGFGQQTQQQTQQPAGGGLFGPTTTAPATTGFGAFGNTTNKSIFGSTQPPTTQPTTGFGAFGSTQQQQNQQPQAQQPSLFGGGTGLFANAQQQQQQPQGAQQPATNPLFGGQMGGTGLFGGGGLFGNTQQQQPQQQQQTQQPAQAGAFGGGGLFGAQKQPVAPTGNLFGGFGQQPTTNTQQPSLFGGNLGQTNAQSTLGGGLFGSSKAAPLGQSTSTGGSLFGSTTQPTGVFGASTNAPGAQGTLTASISQPIGADLPIFDMLPPGPRLVNLDTSQQKKKVGFFVDIPTRSPMPRLGYTPANSRLRGFAASTSTATPAGTNPFAASLALTPSKSHPLSLSRVVDNKVTGADPFTFGRAATPALGSGTRQSVKKVILDKKIEPSELFNKSGSPGVPGGKVVFSPKLSVASRERDAQVAQNQTSGVLESPTPASRPQRTSNRFTAQPAQQPQGEEGQATAELEDGDYWVKPDLETLKQTGYDELSSFKDLIVGRVGYGQIHFLEPVDLTGLPKLGALLGKVIRFDEKECSVYPDSDEVDKPPPGSGLNVAARITLLGCWAVDKSTREPIKDEKHPSTTKHLKRLKKIPNTHFESFDIADGKWTFRVDHF